jgi:hypothetical protein
MLLQSQENYWPHIIPNRLSRIPPWYIICSTCDLQLIHFRKGEPSALAYHWYFPEFLPVYPDYTAVYIDGFFFKVWLVVHSSLKTLSSIVSSYNSICMANLYPIYQALLFIWWEPWQCHLLSRDSLSSTQSPWTIQPLMRYCARCTTCIPPLRSKICSLAGHTGLPSTKAADTAAKKTTL